MNSLILEEVYRESGDGDIVEVDGKQVYKLGEYYHNPILKPWDLGLKWVENNIVRYGSVFNGGAAIYEDRVILMPRIHKNYVKKKRFDEEHGIERYYMENYVSRVWVLESRDGIRFRHRDGLELTPQTRDFMYGIEDIRIAHMYNNEYILVGCGKIKPPFKGSGGDRVAFYRTYDFKNIDYLGIIDAFDSRNAFPFPELIDNDLYMIFRFHPNMHLDKLKYGYNQIIKPMKYRDVWMEIYENKNANLLLKAGQYIHENEKIGGGPPPIKTREGWLLLYHGVGEINRKMMSLYDISKPIKKGYSVSAAILDLNDPRKVIARTKYPLYVPHKEWELEGGANYEVDVPYVVFPVGAITYKDKLLIYAGAGDKYITILTTKIDKLIDYLLS